MDFIFCSSSFVLIWLGASNPEIDAFFDYAASKWDGLIESREHILMEWPDDL
jgi:hypothetical protein